MMATPPPQNAANMRLPRIIGGPCSVQVVSAGIGSPPLPLPFAFCHGRPQMLTTSGRSGSRMSSVQITRLFQPSASFGQEGELALVVDAEAVRAGARRVVEADLLRRIGLADVEDVEAGAGVAALVAGEPLRIDVEDVVADDAQLVAMHAGRRLELPHLLRLARVAHVVDREAFRRKAARRADRADIGVAVVHLDQAAAAPGGRLVVAEQAEAFGFFGKTFGHSSTSHARFACVQVRLIAAADHRLALAERRQLPHAGAAGVLVGRDVGVDEIRLAARHRHLAPRRRDRPGRSTLTPSMPAARAMAAKSGL